MTVEKQEILYNKTKEELTLKDKLYIKSVSNLKGNNRRIAVVAAVVDTFFSVLFAFPLIWLYKDIYLSIFLTIMSATPAGASIFTAITEIKNNYKSVGLTKKEYKELIKSNRLEELIELTKEIADDMALNLNKTEDEIVNCNKPEYIMDEYLLAKLIIARNKKMSLIQRMIQEKQITKAEADEYLVESNNSKIKDKTNVIIEDDENIIGV